MPNNVKMSRDEIGNECRRVLQEEASALAGLTRTVDFDVLAQAVSVLGECKGHIFLSGCGTSAMAARKIAHSLCCIERPGIYLNPADSVHGGLGILKANDVCILLSKGGRTEELLKLVPVCKSKNVFLMVVSENEKSYLADIADLFIHIKVDREPCPFNMLATASILAVISVFDAICISLMRYARYTKEQFAVIHPGGAVGERLLADNKML